MKRGLPVEGFTRTYQKRDTEKCNRRETHPDRDTDIKGKNTPVISMLTLPG